MLFDVSLTEFIFPCETYVKARVGIQHMTHTEFRQLPELEMPPIKNIPIGAILKWNVDAHDDDGNYVLLTIKDNKILYEYLKHDAHYAVYEGNGITSDLAWNHTDCFIRFRELSNLRQQPRAMITAHLNKKEK